MSMKVNSRVVRVAPLGGRAFFEWEGPFFGKAALRPITLHFMGQDALDDFNFRFLTIQPVGFDLNDFAVVMRRDNPLAYPTWLWHRVLMRAVRHFRQPIPSLQERALHDAAVVDQNLAKEDRGPYKGPSDSMVSAGADAILADQAENGTFVTKTRSEGGWYVEELDHRRVFEAIRQAQAKRGRMLP